MFRPRWTLGLVLLLDISTLVFVAPTTCQPPGQSKKPKNMLFITTEQVLRDTSFPTQLVCPALIRLPNLCFNIAGHKIAGCCDRNSFDCDIDVKNCTDRTYKVTVKNKTLQMHDVVVLVKPNEHYSCMPSNFSHNKSFILTLHNCLKPGGKNIRFSYNFTRLAEAKEICDDGSKTTFTIQTGTTVGILKHVTCKRSTEPKPVEKKIVFDASKNPMSPDEAVNVINMLGSANFDMGNDTVASLTIGNITGLISKVPKENHTDVKFGFSKSGEPFILQQDSDLTNISRDIDIPDEASEMASKENANYTGILVFPGMPSPYERDSFHNNEVIAIDMGVEISNLSRPIQIGFTGVRTTGNNVSCISWDGISKTGNISNWTTDGCVTKEANGSVTCQCSHLTFFAILMSPVNINGGGDSPSAPQNISASDLKTLNQITKAGCGMSLFFLGVALFMHFLLRRKKALQSVRILVNLFIAMFFLNISFLVNEYIANMDIEAGCMAMGAFLHYSMLATFTWFFMQALHLHFNINRHFTDLKYYLLYIYISGWVIPVVPVVVLLVLKKYGVITIAVDQGTPPRMCWIKDYLVHLGVNLGYYSVVFIFTLTIFVVTVVQILHFGSKDKNQIKEGGSTKRRFYSLLGLFFLLGLTWGFAFFSYGALLLPSYYIFTILNSFQGFFLFVYYYFSSRMGKDPKASPDSRNTTASNVYTESPYK